MDAQGIFTVLRKYWIVIVVLIVVGGGAGYGYAKSMTEQYRATSSVFVSSDRGATTTELLQGSTFTQDLVQSYAQLATLPAVLTPVIHRLHLNTTPSSLAKLVSANTPLNTVIIEITVTNPSPKRAAVIADNITSSLATVAENLSPRGADKKPSVTMTTVSSAQVPAAPFAPNKVYYVGSGILIGLVIALIFAFLRELLDTRLRTERDLANLTEIPVSGSISRHKPGKLGSPVLMRSSPHSLAAEDFRRLRTNIAFSNVDKPARSILVTSALPAEGKTTTAINLALAIAERSHRVLLVDADLRRPSIAGRAQVEGSVGLTSVLLGTVQVNDAIQSWAGGALDILPAGVIPPNPNQLLSSEAMERLVKKLTPRYDVIVFDSAPLLPFTDSLSLSKLTDGVILVARSKKTRREQFDRAIQSLDVVNARILGLVLNEVKAVQTASYYGYKAPSTDDEEVSAVSQNQDEETAAVVVTPDVTELDEELATK